MSTVDENHKSHLPGLELDLSAGDGLFSIPGLVPATTQWKAQRLQLVNWGGFHGYRQVTFQPGTTLLTGASGSGKSTLLDAYTALMMPSDIAFNGASNTSAGRARGAEQRSLISYLRGQTDTTRDAEGEEQAQVMRGDGTATWGGVAMVFVNDNGTAFTAARIYHVPAHARLGGEVNVRMLTFDGDMDLRVFDEIRDAGLDARRMRNLVPGLGVRDIHTAYTTFAARLFDKLGIGANGDGAKALRLLADVQAGHQFRTVDELYKKLVLEKPDTYAKADHALTHFADLEANYHRARNAEVQAALLGPAATAWQRLSAAREQLAELDVYGLDETGPSLLTLWSLERENDLLETAAVQAKVELDKAKEKAAHAVTIKNSLETQLADLETRHRDAGGGQIQTIEAALSTAFAQRDVRAGELDRLRTQVAAVVLDGGDLTDRDTFLGLLDAGRAFQQTYQTERSQLDAERLQVEHTRWQLHDQLKTAQQELMERRGSSTRMDLHLARLRDQVCAHTRLAVRDAPFLAELVAVAQDEKEWTAAVEVVLSTAARTMLVPADRYEDFSRAINELDLRGRITFDRAERNQDLPEPLDPQTISGKLEYKPSPYEGWVARYVSTHGGRTLCVRTPAELAGPGARVTLRGQTRNGTRGAHGRRHDQNILGFSNEDLIAECERTVARLTRELNALEEPVRLASDRLTALNARRDTYMVLSGATFEQIDVASLDDHIAHLQEELAALLEPGSELSALTTRIAAMKSDLEEARRDTYQGEQDQNKASEKWLALTERKDVVVSNLDALIRQENIELTDAQRTALDAHFRNAVGEEDDPDDLDRWAVHLVALRRLLKQQGESARTEVKRSTNEIEGIFERYLNQYPDSALSPSLDSYPDFADKLQDLSAAKLAELKETFRANMVEWSADDLLQLQTAVGDARREISARLDPINAILATLPFSATNDRLKMRLRMLRRDRLDKFTRELRELARTATANLTDDQLETRYLQASRFLAQLRSPKDTQYDPKVSARDELLDVRRHLEILADRYRINPDAPLGQREQVLASYTSLGSKSGGETQELIAFIVGAALRYRLGDQDKARPRFAPVFLDEGFIKADAEFASRAVQAWTKLRFQLIVGAPFDKCAGLEPHMDAVLLVTKNLTTGRSAVHEIGAETRQQMRMTA